MGNTFNRVKKRCEEFFKISSLAGFYYDDPEKILDVN